MDTEKKKCNRPRSFTQNPKSSQPFISGEKKEEKLKSLQEISPNETKQRQKPREVFGQNNLTKKISNLSRENIKRLIKIANSHNLTDNVSSKTRILKNQDNQDEK